MNKPFFLLICMLFLPASLSIAADARQVYIFLEQQKQELISRARQEKEQAMKEARAQQALIQTDRASLKRAIADLEKKILGMETKNKALALEIETIKGSIEKTRAELEAAGAENKEFQGAVRGKAKDLKDLFLQSMQTGLQKDRHLFLEPLINQEKFPDMEEIRRASDLLFEEIELSGQVRVKENSPLVDRNGRETSATLLILGNFTGIYALDQEVGFFLYSDQSQRYFALSRLPSPKISRNINAYLAGKTDAVYLDVSKGGAVRRLTHELSLAEQVPKGGAIVWPILAIFAIAVLILLERMIFFVRRRCNAETLMAQLRYKINEQDWEGCRTLLETKKKRLIPKVLLTALELRKKNRDEIENALQEAILSEIPSVERFLSTLGMLAAIAPLLGLLGTVTGMINTFHVITQYGTGDPRMMSGGISEALVTTMLGLAVAIPIMLAHTLLSRRVETQISKMEEKAVAFVNLLFKTSAKGGR